MKNITLGILILLCMIHALTANKRGKQRRVRREQAALPPNTTTVYTTHDDIAHFTCTTRDQATISWKKGSKDIAEDDFGVAILSIKNGGSLESHLLIAVTDEDLRGKYECFSSDDPDVAKETFFIGNDPALEGKLSSEDSWAIILALSITIILVSSIAFFLWRGNRRLKKAHAADLEARSRARNGKNGAQENHAVEEEIVEIGANCVREKELENDIKKDPGTDTKTNVQENGNNNNPTVVKNGPQSQPVVPEITVESGPETEKSTQF